MKVTQEQGAVRYGAAFKVDLVKLVKSMELPEGAEFNIQVVQSGHSPIPEVGIFIEFFKPQSEEMSPGERLYNLGFRAMLPNAGGYLVSDLVLNVVGCN